MNPTSPFAVPPLLAAFAAMTLAFALYRLSSLNTFVDHRKTLLRSIFREVCEVYPNLLLLIQNLGKTGLPENELLILSAIHPSAAVLAAEVQDLRKRYNRLLNRLLLIMSLMSLLGLGVVINAGKFPAHLAGAVFILFVLWLFYVWSTLRLELPTEGRPEFIDVLSELEAQIPSITSFADGRRLKLKKDASVV